MHAHTLSLLTQLFVCADLTQYFNSYSYNCPQPCVVMHSPAQWYTSILCSKKDRPLFPAGKPPGRFPQKGCVKVPTHSPRPLLKKIFKNFPTGLCAHNSGIILYALPGTLPDHGRKKFYFFGCTYKSGLI